MTPSTHLQQEMDCGLPARETQTISSTNAPVLSDTMGCPPEQQFPQSLLSVEEEIVQLLAEMQMKANAPVEVHTNNDVIENSLEENVIQNHLEDNNNEPMIMDVTRRDTGDKLEETVITNDLGDNDSSCSGNIGSAGCSQNIRADDDGTRETVKAVDTTGRVYDEALSASLMHVQVPLKLVTKEDGCSLVLLSPPVVDQASRTSLSLQKEKSVVLQNVQENDKSLEAEGNSQVSVSLPLEHKKCDVKRAQEGGCNGVLEENYPTNRTVAGIHNSNADGNSDEIEVVYERRKHVSVPLVVKHEKSPVQQLEAVHFSMDRRDMYSSNPSVAGIHNSNAKEHSDDIEVIYERRKHGPTCPEVKCETSAVQQEETGHLGVDNKEMESLTTVHWEKPIKTEEEKNIDMDTRVSVSGFPADIISATHNSIVDNEKCNEADDEYDCPVCVLATSKAWDENQEKAACLNMITQNLITGCTTVVSASNRNTTGNERVTTSPDNVKEEEPVTSVANCDGYDVKEETNRDYTDISDDLEPVTSVANCDGYDVKEETNKDYTVISDELELESPIPDCGVSAVPQKKQDIIDTEDHDMTCDNMSEISSYKSDIDIVKEEIYFSDQDQDALGFSYAWFGWEQQESEADINEDTADWEMDCPSDINISEDETEGRIEETVTLNEGIQAVDPPKVVDSPVPPKEENSDEPDLQVAHQECSLTATEDKTAKSDHQMAHEESSQVTTKDKSVEAEFHVGHQKRPVVSTQDKSVEACLQPRRKERSPVSTEDKSVEANIHLERKRSTPVSTEDKSVEADLNLEQQESLSVSTKDNTVLSRYFPNCWNPNRNLVVKLRRIEMANYYKGIESGLHSEQQESSPVSAEDNSVGTSMQDGKSTYIRKIKIKDKAQADSDIEAPPEIYRHHIPGHASENHRLISSESLENTTKNFSQENYEEINGDTACNYKCSSCSAVFSSKYGLTKHVFTHIGLDAPVHICKYCGKVFNAALELQKHNKSSCYGVVHKEPSHFSHQRSKCKDGVINFEVKNESIDSEFTCSSCEQVFISKYSLIRHVFKHIDGVQPPSHICKLCGKILSASFSLRRHYKYGCRKIYSKESCHTGNELQEAIHNDDKILNGDDMEKQDAAQVKFALDTTNQDFTSNDVPDHVGGKEIHSYKCIVCGEHFCTASRLKKHFLKLCNRIEHSIQSNGVQGITEEEVVIDGSAKHKKIAKKTTNCEFKCSTCQKVFNTEFHLEMHMSRKIKCTAPQQRDGVIDLFDKVRYLPEINDPSQHHSDIFVKSVPSSNLKISNIHVTYRMSVKTGRKEKVFLCDFCDKPFRKANNLLTHRHTHTGEKYCICRICGNSFSMMGNLKRHVMSHSGDYPYSCNICNRQFKQKEHLKRHRRIHTGETPHKCHICGKRFKQSGSLQKHKVVHTGDKPYQCEVCGRTFALLGNLNQHSRTHSAERMYKCDICLKSFSRSTTLKKHSCITPGEGRRFKCNYCCKYFRSHSLLKQHLAIHLGIRPYKCHICSKTFVGSGNLKLHMYIHTGEKPYICEVCGKTFNQSSSMRRHLRVHKTT